MENRPEFVWYHKEFDFLGIGPSINEIYVKSHFFDAEILFVTHWAQYYWIKVGVL